MTSEFQFLVDLDDWDDLDFWSNLSYDNPDIYVDYEFKRVVFTCHFPEEKECAT